MKVCALVTDLMDRSRLTAALDGVVFTLTPDADVVVVDLAKGIDQISFVRAQAPHARIVCYGPHVDDAAMQAEADAVMPRSRFFRDIPGNVLGRR
jgi:hypothetical protein